MVDKKKLQRVVLLIIKREDFITVRELLEEKDIDFFVTVALYG